MRFLVLLPGVVFIAFWEWASGRLIRGAAIEGIAEQKGSFNRRSKIAEA